MWGDLGQKFVTVPTLNFFIKKYNARHGTTLCYLMDCEFIIVFTSTGWLLIFSVVQHNSSMARRQNKAGVTKKRHTSKQHHFFLNNRPPDCPYIPGITRALYSWFSSVAHPAHTHTDGHYSPKPKKRLHNSQISLTTRFFRVFFFVTPLIRIWLRTVGD